MARGMARSPIFVADADAPSQRVLVSALETEGFQCCLSRSNGDTVKVNEQPLALVDGATTKHIDPWLAYAMQGGALVLVNPDRAAASKLGLSEYEGIVSRAVFFFAPLRDQLEVGIEVFGSISRYRAAPGRLAGFLKADNNDTTYPGMVELPWGQGKIVLILFCLGRYIAYLRQRERSDADSTAHGSAEHILLARIDKSYLCRPQLDILMGFLSRVITTELVRVSRPFPRFASLPEGKKSLVVFSFDDACPSGRPVREAWSSLFQCERLANESVRLERGKQSFIRRLTAFLSELIKYPLNYEADLRALVNLFNKNRARGSVFVLPFLGAMKNRPRLTGYKGFSRKAYKLLKNAGWDVGTHIKPAILEDYAVVQKSFRRRFSVPPKGHRGHELGWVGWDEDWSELAKLDYLYDTTWNWGGYAGLTWILGTSYPFHPVDESGNSFAVLEVPVVAWLDDLYRVPQESLESIENTLSKYPGVYHFAGHTRLIRNVDYQLFIESILNSIRRQKDIGLGWSLAELANFWNSREASTVEETEWDVREGILSFTVTNHCQDYKLAIDVPHRCGERKIVVIYVDDKHRDFTLQDYFGMEYARITLQKGSQRVTAHYI